MEKTMTEREILRKVIEKAVKNGYKDKEFSKNFFSGILDHILELLDGKRNGLINANRYYALIFSKEFAKAFFGEVLLCEKCLTKIYAAGEYVGSCEHFTIESRGFNMEEGSINGWGILISEWEFHLQRMVIKEEPLNYLIDYLRNLQRNKQQLNNA